MRSSDFRRCEFLGSPRLARSETERSVKRLSGDVGPGARAASMVVRAD